MQNSALGNASALLGRIMLAAIFVIGGYNKIKGYDGTQAYMAKQGVPGILLPLVILTELGGGLLILIGWQTRLVAFLMAGFTLVAAALFHNFLLADAAAYQLQFIHFMKNLAIAGGFLGLVAHGAGGWSIDGRGSAT